jgi:hypothetical protein
VWTKDTAAACDLPGGNWTAYGPFLSQHAPNVFQIGLPPCYAWKHAAVSLLSADSARALTEDQVLELLSTGVYMDAEALDHLNQMGYGELTGFAVERTQHIDCIEKLTDHPLNAAFAGRERDGRQSFYKGPAHILKRHDPQSQALAKLIDYADSQIAPCASGVFENRLGGRVCVAGYYPWSFLHSRSKSTQMKSIMRWLSKDRLPAYVSSFHKINLWVREPDDGSVALTLTNSCFDPATDVSLLVLTDSKEVDVFDMQCRAVTIRCAGVDGPYTQFVIPHIDPWRMRLVVTRP